MPSTHQHNHHRPNAAPAAVLTCAAMLSGVGLAMLATTPTHHDPSQVRITTASWITDETAGEQGVPATDETDADTHNQGMRECVITLSSGRTISGELISESSREVVVRINGIDTTFKRHTIANVVVLPPVQERYEQLRATVPDDDVESRLALVEWLRARRAYALAVEELESILVIDPLNAHAKLLHAWLQEHEKLSRGSGRDSARDRSTDKNDAQDQTSTQGPGRTYSIKRSARPHLSDEQLNLMRVYEIDLRDPPRIRVPDSTMRTLMQEKPDKFSPNAQEREAILHLPEVEKLKLLFTYRARHLYAEVEVQETPQSLKLFKDQVHTGRGWLINACASTRCHGGVDAGSFQLINTKPNSDETALTNLYIIEKTRLSDGRPLIDYDHPDRSPLLQMGMIPSKALTPHPELPRDYPGLGFRPIFRDTRDRKYEQGVEWIRSMYQPRPRLDFDYPLGDDLTPPKPDQANP